MMHCATGAATHTLYTPLSYRSQSARAPNQRCHPLRLEQLWNYNCACTENFNANQHSQALRLAPAQGPAQHPEPEIGPSPSSAAASIQHTVLSLVLHLECSNPYGTLTVCRRTRTTRAAHSCAAYTRHVCANETVFVYTARRWRRAP